jgi:hypothetical protein
MVDHELEYAYPRKFVWRLVRPPEAIPPESEEPAEWTLRLARTVTDYAFAYLRYAESALDMRVPQLVEVREKMVALNEDDYKRKRPEDLPDLCLFALERKVAALRKDGYTLSEMAVRRFGMSRGKFHRRLREARRRRSQ